MDLGQLRRRGARQRFLKNMNRWSRAEKRRLETAMRCDEARLAARRAAEMTAERLRKRTLMKAAAVALLLLVVF